MEQTQEQGEPPLKVKELTVHYQNGKATAKDKYSEAVIGNNEWYFNVFIGEIHDNGHSDKVVSYPVDKIVRIEWDNIF